MNEFSPSVYHDLHLSCIKWSLNAYYKIDLTLHVVAAWSTSKFECCKLTISHGIALYNWSKWRISIDKCHFPFQQQALKNSEVQVCKAGPGRWWMFHLHSGGSLRPSHPITTKLINLKMLRQNSLQRCLISCFNVASERCESSTG